MIDSEDEQFIKDLKNPIKILKMIVLLTQIVCGILYFYTTYNDGGISSPKSDYFLWIFLGSFPIELILVFIDKKNSQK
jgi:hypothetical protein